MKCCCCKWWIGYEDEQDGHSVRCCHHPMVCKPSHGQGMSKIMTASGVLTCDEGGMTGELMTGPLFGCVHFEEGK